MHDQINQVDITTEQFHALDIGASETPSALLYNPLTSLVIFTFMNDDYIYSSKLDGHVAEVFTEFSKLCCVNNCFTFSMLGKQTFSIRHFEKLFLFLPGHGL